MRMLWHRLLTNPAVRIESVDAAGTRLRVDGLFCDVCALRTERALERLDGVQNVRVHLDSGTAVVEGTPADAAAYERAIASAVVLRPLRAAIDAIARGLRDRGALAV